MFGRNEPRKRETNSRVLQVHEIFYTIQGEGPFAGLPAIFIRLTGCNLRCWFCDTKWDDEADPYLSVESIVSEARAVMACSEIRNWEKPLVVITGGEPLRQDLSELIPMLYMNGFEEIQVETAGTFWQDCLDLPYVTTVVSPKTGKVHPNYRARNVCWKYVLIAGEVDEADGLPASPMQRVRDSIGGGFPARPNPGDPVYLQAVDEIDGEKNKENMKAVRDSALEFGYRAGVQLHKIFGVA